MFHLNDINELKEFGILFDENDTMKLMDFRITNFQNKRQTIFFSHLYQDEKRWKFEKP